MSIKIQSVFKDILGGSYEERIHPKMDKNK